MNSELQVDFGLVSSAMFPPNPSLASAGFIDLQTGEVRFIYEKEGDAAGWIGVQGVFDTIFDRAEVEANPERWLRIPIHDHVRSTEWSEQQRLLDGFASKHRLRLT